MPASQHDLQGMLKVGICESPLVSKSRTNPPASQDIADHLQGLMKGYISREHAMVVLNKKGAFPGTGV